MPDLIDYNKDLTDERNVYLALIDIFKDCEILKLLDDDFGAPDDRLYELYFSNSCKWLCR